MHGIPVLTYHALNITGNEYANNDHVAFASDLELMTRLGWRVQPLHKIVETLFVRDETLPDKTLAISFDDATDFDYADLPHPTAGMQRSMLNIMRDFQAKYPDAQPHLHATSFVIASPDARKAMDRHCVINADWINEHWWPDAVATGLIGIANHSWDHNHVCVERVAQRNQEKGNFFCIDSMEDADAQIRQAADYISSRAPNPSVNLFGYPYGHVNKFLSEEYLPNQSKTERAFVTAAFGTDAGYVTPGSNRWNLPRFVCGWHWKSSEELEELLSGAG